MAGPFDASHGFATVVAVPPPALDPVVAALDPPFAEDTDDEPPFTLVADVPLLDFASLPPAALPCFVPFAAPPLFA